MIIFILSLLGLAALFFLPSFRRRLVEELKAFSDTLLLLFLRSTSEFGRELTKDGLEEQRMWREQRLQNLRGLAPRSKEALSSQRSAVSKEGESQDGHE